MITRGTLFSAPLSDLHRPNLVSPSTRTRANCSINYVTQAMDHVVHWQPVQEQTQGSQRVDLTKNHDLITYYSRILRWNATRSSPCRALLEVATSDRVAFQVSHGPPCAALLAVGNATRSWTHRPFLLHLVLLAICRNHSHS